MRPEDITVELKPHLGFQRTRIGNLEIDLKQYKVMANGFHVGYIDKRPGFGVKLIHQTLPQDAKAVIKRKVDEILGRDTPPIATVQVFREEDEDFNEED